MKPVDREEEDQGRDGVRDGPAAGDAPQSGVEGEREQRARHHRRDGHSHRRVTEYGERDREQQWENRRSGVGGAHAAILKLLVHNVDWVGPACQGNTRPPTTSAHTQATTSARRQVVRSLASLPCQWSILVVYEGCVRWTDT